MNQNNTCDTKLSLKGSRSFIVIPADNQTTAYIDILSQNRQ